MSAQQSQVLAQRVNLNNGLSMPQIKLGVYMTTNNEAKQATIWALEAGYRGIDSAQWYGNERAVGNGIKEFLASPQNTQQLTREDIWFTSKLKDNGTYKQASAQIKRSVQECGLGYIDEFLLHSPYGGKQARLESWRAIEDAIDAGLVKTGGISNFGEKHIQELVDSRPRVIPAVNQIEIHPFNTRARLASFSKAQGILLEAYAPLVRAERFGHPTLTALATKYAVSEAQVLLKWSLQHGYCPLPKSVSKARIVSNSELDGFELGGEDVTKLDELDEYLVTDWDPTTCP